VALVLSAFVLACGGPKSNTPTAPTTPSNLLWTVSGSLVSSVTGGSVAGATIVIISDGSTFTSDSNGAFTIGASVIPATPMRISIIAPGYIRRDTFLQGGATRSGVVIDLIRDAAPFSSTFYRELVRGLADGSSLGTTRRWQQDPSFYIQTIDETNASVPQPFIDTTRSIIPDIVRDVTAGRFQASRIETGPDATVPAGSILIKFPSASFGSAGRASGVGVNPCTVQVWQGDVPSGVPLVIAHEIAHCLGLSHITVTGLPPQEAGLMGKFGFGTWKQPRLTDAERFHAAILYSRPVGNADPDVDPATWLFGNAASSARTAWVR